MENENSFYNTKIILIVKFLFKLIIISLIIYFLAGIKILPDERDYFSSDLTTFNSGWEQVLSDGSKVPVNIPGKCEAFAGETVVIQTYLPENIEHDVCLCIQSLWQDIEIYIDEELRRDYSTKDSRFFGKDSTIRYLFADVYPSDAGKLIEIRTTTSTPSYSGSFRDIYLTDTSNLWMYLLDTYGSLYLLELIMIIISCVCIILCGLIRIFYKKRIVLIYLAWSLFFAAIWLFSEMKFRQLIFSNVSLLSNLTFWSLMLIPFPFIIYMNEIQEGRYKKYYSFVLTYVSAAFFIVTFLQIFNIMDFRNTLLIVHIGIVMSIMLVLVTLGIDIYKKYVKNYYFVAVGVFGIMFCALFELYLFYSTNSKTIGSYICAGMIFLLFMAAFKTVQDTIDIEKEKHLAVIANEAKAQFLANMSHEIRTPINSIIGMNEMILRENTNETIQEYANNIHTSSKMLLGLINDVLDFSKIESGQLTLVEGKYHLATFITDELLLLENRAKSKQLFIKLDINPNLPSELYGDELRLKQIVTNILTNAVKYTSKGSITLSVQYKKIDTENILLCISVADTGMGIKSENLDKLFDNFTRLDEKKNKHIEGTGLGLNITHRLVSMMNGEISVESEYGKGSVFHVRIPQKILNTIPIGDIQSSLRQPVKETQLQKHFFTAPNAHILVVDDNHMNLEVVKGLLKRTCIQLDLIHSGEECLLQTRRNRYHMIFMDHMMPGMDGIETLKALRKDRTNPNINTPVIVLTANAISGSKEMYLSHGFNDYLSKPIESAKLEDLLLQYLPENLIIQDNDNQTDNKNADANSETDSVSLPKPPANHKIYRPTDEINHEKGLYFCANSEEFYQEILASYLKQGLIYQDKLLDYYHSKDWDNYEIIVHALKSSSMNIGAENFSEASKKQELAAKDKNEALLAETFSEYYDCMVSLFHVVESMLP